MSPLRHLPLGPLSVVAVTLTILAGCSGSSGSDADRTTTSAPGATTTTSAASVAEPLARYASYQSVSYDDSSHWVCRPDRDDICDRDLDATHVTEDGTLTVEPFERADDPPIDCFYVYPTISRDATAFSDWDLADDEEGWVTLNQAARLQSTCRLFAPGYRQRTLAALLGGLGGGGAPAGEGDPFADVLDAFKTYMADDNGGRGFVLIGHSQGTGMLNELIQAEIDSNEDVRDLLVGAYLAGGSVAVPSGEVAGGDFEHVPLCQESAEVGCVTTWATFRDSAPPAADSFFGRALGSDRVTGCVNPAAVGSRAELEAYLPADAAAAILAPGGDPAEAQSWVGPAAGEIDTPFVRLDDLVTGECVERDGFHYLEAAITGAGDGPRSDDIPGDLGPAWGLHLVDVNIVMGDIVRNVTAQAKAFSGG